MSQSYPIFEKAKAGALYQGHCILRTHQVRAEIADEFKTAIEKNSDDENKILVYRLTYYPNLIGLVADLIIRKKMLFSECTHPLLNELAFQSSILYQEYLIDDKDYDDVRDCLHLFLTELKQKLPSAFETMDKYCMLPVDRIWSNGISDKAHVYLKYWTPNPDSDS